MNNIVEADQWKLVGNCSKCRRNKYCTTECTARKKRLNMLAKAIVTKAVLHKLNSPQKKSQPKSNKRGARS